jgi:hypothetical protein
MISKDDKTYNSQANHKGEIAGIMRKYIFFV